MYPETSTNASSVLNDGSKRQSFAIAISPTEQFSNVMSGMKTPNYQGMPNIEEKSGTSMSLNNNLQGHLAFQIKSVMGKATPSLLNVLSPKSLQLTTLDDTPSG